MNNKRTIVYVAQPDSEQSNSFQFLVQSGQALTDVCYVDLAKEYQGNEGFNCEQEWQRLVSYERIIFQFPLYWYQAPAILKQWLDVVFGYELPQQAKKQLANKELGIVVIAGVKESEYQIGGREGVTISDLVAPYYALARHFKMVPLKFYAIHQFHYLSEIQKMQLMLTYATYLATGTVGQFPAFQAFVQDRLAQLTPQQLPLDSVQQLVFEQFQQDLEVRQQELSELQQLVQKW